MKHIKRLKTLKKKGQIDERKEHIKKSYTERKPNTRQYITCYANTLTSSI